METGDRARRLVVAFACLGMSALLGGCFHKKAPPTLPAILHAPDTAPPLPDSPVMETELPDDIAVAPQPEKVTEIKPKRVVRRTTPKGTTIETTPVDAVNAGSDVDASAIGELSAGGDSNPKAQQDANDLITSSERRVNGLPQKVAAQQQTSVRRVRYFLRQARQALGSGDAEGARTLATKAKLLLDDLEK
jgi:hypothetical protein